MNVESVSDLLDVEDTNIALTPFDSADISAVKAAFECELLLGKSLVLSQEPNPMAKSHPNVVVLAYSHGTDGATYDDIEYTDYK